jgi:hypothetical protein
VGRVVSIAPNHLPSWSRRKPNPGAFGYGQPAIDIGCEENKRAQLRSAEAVSRLSAVTDRMHALLVARADELMGCTENSPEEAELAALTDVIEAYEAQRWPLGKVPRGKG